MTHKLFICTLVTITPYSHQSAAFIAHVQEHYTVGGGASMKGKKEGGEKKGKVVRKKVEGEKKKKREREKKKEFHSRARTRDLPLYSQLPMATAWR